MIFSKFQPFIFLSPFNLSCILSIFVLIFVCRVINSSALPDLLFKPWVEFSYFSDSIFFFSFGFLHSYFILSPSCSLSFSHCSGVCTTWPIALFNCRAFGEIEFCRGISRLFTLSSSLPWKFLGEHLFSSLVFSQCPYPCLAYHRS